MKGKIFTVEEANRMLPLVSRIAEDIVAGYGGVTSALQAYEAAKSASHREPGDQPDLQQADADVREALENLQGLVEEIEALGGTVKDYEHGLVDFYGDVAGEIVYLCWRRGEEAITHFHNLEEGYTMRRELPAAKAA
jgi:hypothetical protein